MRQKNRFDYMGQSATQVPTSLVTQVPSPHTFGQAIPQRASAPCTHASSHSISQQKGSLPQTCASQNPQRTSAAGPREQTSPQRGQSNEPQSEEQDWHSVASHERSPQLSVQLPQSCGQDAQFSFPSQIASPSQPQGPQSPGQLPQSSPTSQTVFSLQLPQGPQSPGQLPQSSPTSQTALPLQLPIGCTQATLLMQASNAPQPLSSAQFVSSARSAGEHCWEPSWQPAMHS